MAIFMTFDCDWETVGNEKEATFWLGIGRWHDGSCVRGGLVDEETWISFRKRAQDIKGCGSYVGGRLMTEEEPRQDP